MATPETSKKRLALAIIDYLNSSLKDGTISSDEGESIEIATSCIAEAFKVDPTDQTAVKDALGGQSLLSIYSVYEKLKGKSTASTAGTSSAAEGRPATPQTSAKGPENDETKKKADELKGKGNQAMQRKAYDEAIDLYTQALNLNPLNPIYLSNRAAAYSGAQRHEEAKGDAEMAVAADPTFAKAWSRLGLANFALGDAKGSMEAYKKGIDAEGNGGSDAMRKGYETAKRKVAEEEGPDAADEIDTTSSDRGMPGGGGGMPDLSALAGMFGGGGGGAGGGGMPDLGSLMNNPMMRQMAQNIMSDPSALSNLMSNPRIREMAGQFGGGGAGAGAAPGGAPGAGAGASAGGGGAGGGMPDLSSLMNDPNIMEMAQKFMGGGAGGAPGAGRGRGE